LNGGDFASVFELYKERYLQQDQQGQETQKALDRFQSWLKNNTRLFPSRSKAEKQQKIDLGKFITDIVQEARDILAEKGVQINCISLGLKESSKCISAFGESTIYYRLGKTCPRKGKYSGLELLVMELVMDGNKNNIFIPLLERQEAIEKQLGINIERENHRIESTGKYRFKLYFPFENDDSEDSVEGMAKVLAQFIHVTREELIKLGIS
jgi:hypothetical protein